MEARMRNIAMVVPDAMQALHALKASAEKGGVQSRTLGLVELRASQINGCSVCVDMHTRHLKKAGETDERRMMFSCCHPELSTEVQVTLILKTLCGFSVSEIAHALLAGEDSIEKRLGRARKLFRLSGTFVDLTNASDIPGRLAAVHRAI